MLKEICQCRPVSRSSDLTLYSLVFSRLWPFPDDKIFALDLAARTACNTSAAGEPKYESFLEEFGRSSLTALGIAPKDSVREYLVNVVVEIFVDVVQFWTRSEYCDFELPKSVISLNAQLSKQESLPKQQECIAQLIDVFRHIREFECGQGNVDKMSSLWRLRMDLLQEPKDNLKAAELYLSVFEGAEDTSLEEKSILDLLLGIEQWAASVYAPIQLWRFHPEVHNVGREVAQKALLSELDAEFQTRVFNVWPELAVPHLLNKLNKLKGFGHDHTIDFAEDMVQSAHPKSLIKMLEVGAKMSTLESEMREKLLSLYGPDKKRELETLFQSKKDEPRETPFDRLEMFELGMKARGIQHKRVSILDFITFGDLKTQLWTHQTTKRQAPAFKTSKIGGSELSYHSQLLSVFRNAWAHHQQLESGFEEFEKSYHFVREWVKSLEKRETDGLT